MKKLVPLLDRIIAKKIESTLKKQSAIIMTTTQTKSNEAVVVEVGPGVEKSDGTRKPMQCKKDDIIIFDARFGFEIELEDEMFQNNDFVTVNINRIHLVDKKENSLYLTMVHPTKDMLLSCEMKDGNYRMFACSFGFNRNKHIIKTQKNSAFVDIKEWILPGHGAVITWAPITGTKVA